MNVPARAFRRQTLTASRRLQRASVRTPLRGATATIRTVHSGIPSVKVNNDRMSASLHHTCQWGAAHRYGNDPTATGMRRLTLDDNDARARKWFVDETSALGCEHVIDQMGNIFSVRPGKKEGPPTAMGSHLDTQPSGGRYDGILGIHAAIESLRVLHENRIETEFPVCVVNWTNEEGARFPSSVVSSHVWAGKYRLEDAWDLKEVPALATGGQSAELKTMKSELERIGFLGETKCSHEAMPLAAHFELHIEQGPILEAKGKKVGIVKGGQAYRWFTLKIKGQEAHTGSTPYENRADALQCAAHIIIASKRIASEHKGLCSTGILSLQPGSTNTIPGEVFISLDMRHPSDDALTKMEAAIREETSRIATDAKLIAKPCSLEWVTDTESKAVLFHEDCINSVRESAISALDGREDLTEEMFSGAGHDSCATSIRCPTSMIFVPSRDGISHNPKEYTSPEDCAIGAQVLLGAVLRYDALRASRAST